MSTGGHDHRSARRRRRLLLVIDSPEGGLAAVAGRHRTWFRERGWDVEIAGPEPGPHARAAPDHTVAVPQTARDVRGLLVAAHALRATVRADRPDVVHCHGPRSLVVARLAGIRRPFVTIHGTGGVASDPAGYNRLREGAVRNLPRLAAAAFSAAPELPPPWRFVAHASPQLRSLPRLPVPTVGPPTFLWMARLDEGRSPSMFVQAITEIARRRPVRGIVAGTGPHLRQVRQLAEHLGAPIDFVGHAEPAELLRTCWALVLFSSHEAVNFAVQEAMWTGRPVVTSPLPGITWLAGDTVQYVSGVADTVTVLDELCRPGTAADRGDRTAARIRETLHPDDPWPTIEAAYAQDPPPQR